MTLNDLKSSSMFHNFNLFISYVLHFILLIESTTLPRPTDMKHHTKTSVKDDDDYNTDSFTNLNIRNFPDPEDIYSLTLGAADTSQSSVYIPNVRDENGKLITPDQYDKKLIDGTVVSVTVYLKL